MIARAAAVLIGGAVVAAASVPLAAGPGLAATAAVAAAMAAGRPASTRAGLLLAVAVLALAARHAGSEVPAWSPAAGAFLLVAAELAFDPSDAVTVERSVLVRRRRTLALTLAGGLAVSAACVALATAPIAGGAALSACGALAAGALIALLGRLAR